MNMRIYSKEIVEKNPNTYELYECDTCGNEFGREKYIEKPIRTCSHECSDIFKHKRLRKHEMLDLFYYRVKFPREFDLEEYKRTDYFDYSSVEINILMKLKGQEKSKDIYWIIEKCEGEIKKLKDGDTSKRSTYVKACQKLIEKGLIRKTRKKSDTGRKTRYITIEKIVILKQGCPWCKNKNYKFFRNEKKLKCIKCNLVWNI